MHHGFRDYYIFFSTFVRVPTWLMAWALISVIFAARPVHATSANPALEHRYAVVVGNNIGLRHEQPLRYAERDAERFAELLTHLAGVPDENLVLLRAPTAEELSRVLAHMRTRIAHERPAGQGRPALFMFYYSGHADGLGLHLDGTELPYKQLNAHLQAIPAPARLVVVDACQSGDLTRAKGVRPAQAFKLDLRDQFDGEGVAIITSSAAGEDAQESERLAGGVFTHHFMAALRGAGDSSGDGHVTLTEAYRYSYRNTIRTTSRARFVQHPSYAFDLRGQNDLVLTWLTDRKNTGYLVLSDPGDYLLLSARKSEDVVLELNLPQATRLVVAEGEYILRERRDSGVFETEVTVTARATTHVDPGDLDAIPMAISARRGGGVDRRWSLGLALAGGLSGPMLKNATPGYGGSLGIMLELRPITLGARLRYRIEQGENSTLTRTQHIAGGDLGLYKFFDFARVSPGLGLRVGTDIVWQIFESTGVAPPRRSTTFRVGPVLALHLHFGSRLSAIVDIGIDTVILRARVDDADSTPTPSPASALMARPVPYAELGFSLSLF